MTVTQKVTSGKKGRGRLSSIDQLPEIANGEIQWAVNELARRERTQADILFELNDKLEVIGCDTVSSSAFNRFSTRKASVSRRLSEVSRIATAVAEVLGPKSSDDITIMLVQQIKETAFSILERSDLNPKQLQETARALNAALAAEKTSNSVKNSKQNDSKKERSEIADAVVEQVKDTLGITKETATDIRSKILGIDLTKSEDKSDAGS